MAITVRSVGGVIEEINKVKSSALYFKNGGVTTCLKVAHMDFTVDQIVENTSVVLKKMYTIFDPSVVQSISIKAADSVSLPLYQCVRPRKATPKPIITRPPVKSIPIEAETAAFERLVDTALVNPKKRKAIFSL